MCEIAASLLPESLLKSGQYATISPVLYANLKHPYLKKEYPDWPTRAKQVAKLWRKATQEERAPFLVRSKSVLQ